MPEKNLTLCEVLKNLAAAGNDINIKKDKGIATIEIKKNNEHATKK